MHHLTFPPDSSIFRACGKEVTVVSSFTWIGLGDTRRKDCGFTALELRAEGVHPRKRQPFHVYVRALFTTRLHHEF